MHFSGKMGKNGPCAKSQNPWQIEMLVTERPSDGVPERKHWLIVICMALDFSKQQKKPRNNRKHNCFQNSKEVCPAQSCTLAKILTRLEVTKIIFRCWLYHQLFLPVISSYQRVVFAREMTSPPAYVLNSWCPDAGPIRGGFGRLGSRA